jgi:hypothetical protein
MPDTETTLRALAQARADAARAEAQEAARRVINRQDLPAADIAEILAALGLDGSGDLPFGVCRICGNDLPGDRQGCKRQACKAERTRRAREAEALLEGAEAQA